MPVLFKFIQPHDWRCALYNRGILVSVGRKGDFRHWFRLGARARAKRTKG